MKKNVSWFKIKGYFSTQDVSLDLLNILHGLNSEFRFIVTSIKQTCDNGLGFWLGVSKSASEAVRGFLSSSALIEASNECFSMLPSMPCASLYPASSPAAPLVQVDSMPSNVLAQVVKILSKVNGIFEIVAKPYPRGKEVIKENIKSQLAKEFRKPLFRFFAQDDQQLLEDVLSSHYGKLMERTRQKIWLTHIKVYAESKDALKLLAGSVAGCLSDVKIAFSLRKHRPPSSSPKASLSELSTDAVVLAVSVALLALHKLGSLDLLLIMRQGPTLDMVLLLLCMLGCGAAFVASSRVFRPVLTTSEELVALTGLKDLFSVLSLADHASLESGWLSQAS